MQIARSAICADRLSRSASETAAAGSTPGLWHARMTRTAISPRLAIKTRVTLMDGSRSGGFDQKERLAMLDELAVLHDRFDDHAFDAGAHTVENLHDLDEADGGIFSDRIADSDEGRRARFRGDVKGAEQRRAGRRPAVRNTHGPGPC